ncbi:MAG: hypothetical protein WAK55_21815 [Xanthobacteraceae bacterium]
MNRRTFLYTFAVSGGVSMTNSTDGWTAPAMSPQPPFHLRAEIQNGELLIHYVIENPSPRDFYLYTHEIVANDRIDEVPGIEFDYENRTLAVYKLPNVAEGTQLYLPIRALFTPVRAGTRFEGTISVSLPAREFRHGAVPAQALCLLPSRQNNVARVMSSSRAGFARGSIMVPRQSLLNERRRPFSSRNSSDVRL